MNYTDWMDRTDRQTCSAALTALIDAVPTMSRQTHRVLSAILDPNERRGQGRCSAIARKVGASNATLMSQWSRCGWSLREVMNTAAIVRLTGLLTLPEMSFSAAAAFLGFSSTQSAGRFLRHFYGIGFDELRNTRQMDWLARLCHLVSQGPGPRERPRLTAATVVAETLVPPVARPTLRCAQCGALSHNVLSEVTYDHI